MRLLALWARSPFRQQPSADSAVTLPPTFALILRAYLQLVVFDFFVTRGNFAALYDRVRRYPRGNGTTPPDGTERICAAVDLASIWYWKQIHCLQRSAATACLLKRYAVPAEMIIGAQPIPFKAHAWVEVGGYVVSDKAYVREMYAVLDRC